MIRPGNSAPIRIAGAGAFVLAIGVAAAVGVAIGVVVVVARPILPPDQGHTAT